MAPLPRELIRWMQTLQLPFAIRQPKRDLANGYIFAEICARYWDDVELHSFENKCSLKNKESNWKALKRTFKNHQVNVTEYEIECVINMTDDMAIRVLEALYTATTNRVIQQVAPTIPAEVTQVPTFIRSTTNSNLQQQLAAEQKKQQEQEVVDKPQVVNEANKVASPSPQKRARAAPKPKPQQKSGAIRAVAPDESEEGAEAKPITFSSVTVKALAPQTLQRMGTADDRATTAGSAAGKGMGDGEISLSAVSSLIEKVLIETNTAPWPLSGATPTLAEYFSKNRGSLSTSLKNIIWSRLMAGASELAAYILVKPSDCQIYLEFCHGAFVAPEEVPLAEEVKDNEKAKALLSTTLAMMYNQSAHVTTSLLSSVVMPSVAAILVSCSSAVKQRIASVLKSSVDRHSASTVLSHLHEALLKAPGSTNTDASFTTFLMTAQYFFESGSSGKSAASRHTLQPGDLDRSNDDTQAHVSSTLLDDTQLALGPILMYNANAGLVRPSPSCRAAALSMYASMLSRKNLAWLLGAPHVVQLISRTLIGPTQNVDSPTADLIAQSLSVLVAATGCVAQQNNAEPSDEIDDNVRSVAATLLQIVAQLCDKSKLFESGSFTRSMRLHVIRDLGLILPSLADLVAVAGLSTADHEAILSNFVDSLCSLNEEDTAHLLNASGTSNALKVYSILFRDSNTYCNFGAVDSWSPLPVLSTLTTKLRANEEEVKAQQLQQQEDAGIGATSSGGASPQPNVELLQWYGRLIVNRSLDIPLCRKESDLSQWWDLMKEMVADVEAALYGAEIAGQRPKADTTEAAVELGTLSNAVLYRFHVHLSGRSVQPADSDELPQAYSKALDWFRTNVATSM